MSTLKAAIDLGTNTVRLLIGSAKRATIERKLVSRYVTRLGGGFSREQGIAAAAQERTLTALNDFSMAMKEFNVLNYRAVATSAVRDAVNGEAFCQRVRLETGISLEVISGHEEAALTLRGVNSGLDTTPETLIVFDVGGGSTEYTVSANGRVLFSRSLPLGVVRLTEGKGSVVQMAEKIERELLPMLKDIKALGIALSNSTIVGTAGTATTLAAISLKLTDYDYSKVNNCLLAKGEILSIYRQLLPLTPAERLSSVKGLERGREDLIIAGALITLKTLELFSQDAMKVSDFGLLEGILLDI